MQPNPPDADPANGMSRVPRRSNRSFLYFCALVALLKFALISTNEISSVQGDAAIYARQALGPWTLGLMPGYPIWLRLCQIFEIPQRIAIEGLYLLSVVVLGYAAKKVFDARTGYIIVGLLALAPYTYFVFDLGLPDGFYLCLTLLGLAVSTHLLLARTRLELLAYSVIFGALLGLMAITRNEDPLLALWLLLIVGAVTYTLYREPRSILKWGFWRKPVVSGLLAGATACFVVFCLCLSFYVTDGVFARDATLIPGHFRLLKDLAQIDTGRPQQRYIPISKASRELAYSVSPTLAQLRSSIEDPGDNWQVLSRQTGLPAGEIAGDGILRTFNAKLLSAPNETPTTAEAKYERIDAELSAAFQTGRLKRRFVVNPLLGGDIPGLLGSLQAGAAAALSAALSDLTKDPPDENVNASLFNQAFLRRAALVKFSEVTLEGWALVNTPGQKIAKVVVGSDVVPSAPVLIGDRPDVVASVSKQLGWTPDVVGFHATLQTRSPDQVTITYLTSNGSQAQAQRLKAHQVSLIPVKPATGLNVLQAIDLVSALTVISAPEWQHNLQTAVIIFFRVISSPLLSTVIIAIAFALSSYALFWKEDGRWTPTFLFLSLGLTLWISRILFYAVLDARAWNAAQVRYLAPAHALELAVLSVAIAVLTRISAERGEVERKKPSDPRFIN